MIAPLESLHEVTFERDGARRFVVGHWVSRTMFVPVVGEAFRLSASEVVCEDSVLDDVRAAA